MFNLFIFFISFCLSFLVYKIYIPIFKNKIIATPNSRSSHSLPTPNGGGIVFVSLFILISFYLKNFWPLFLTPLAIIGFMDDIKGQSQKLRFFVQLSTCVYFCLIFLNRSITSELSLLIEVLIYLFLIFLSISITNFVNFMDGIDGLVASNILCLLLFKFYFGDTTVIYLIGFLSGFLYFNWYPAKIFMGDVGSTFLGGTLVYILISANNLEHFFAYLMASAPLLIDPVIVILRRLINSENIFTAHKKHFYQRLVHNDIKHWKVSILYLVASLVLCLSYILGSLKIQLIALFLLLIVAFFIDKKFALTFDRI